MCGLQCVASSSELPSLQHGRLAFPRPNPTILHPSIQSKDQKRMGEAVLEEDEDWIPNNEVMSPISDDLEDIRSVRGVSRLPIVKVISTDHLSSVFNQPAVNTHNTRCQTSYLDA